MVNDTLTQRRRLVAEYRDYTDKYFLRTKRILQKERINPLVRYQVFARQDVNRLTGIEEAVSFIKDAAGNNAKVYALEDRMEYNAKEPIMKIEGRVQDIVDLETVYLGLLAGSLSGKIDMAEVRKKAGDIVNAAEGKPVFYFGARHFSPYLDEQIARICKEEGFVACSTDIGAKAWNAKGAGTIPHALVMSYAAFIRENNIDANPTVEAAKGFDKSIDKAVPRITLIDTFNREITDSLATAGAIKDIAGFRIDTCGENFAEGANNVELPELKVPEKYLRCGGVTIPAVWALRNALDNNGYGNLELVVSSGFNAEKTAAFVKADKAYNQIYGKLLFNTIGTGSVANPLMATSDIVAYFSEKEDKWIPLAKAGREEVKSEMLKEAK